MKLSGALLLVVLATVLPTTAHALCGDGNLDAGEACDDGNVLNGDGCSSTCTVEAGYDCVAQSPVAIVNGNFERPGVQMFNATGSYIPGWTIDSTTEVDYVSSSEWTCSGFSVGCVDLSGTPSRGILYQDVATSPGTTYTLTFRMAANCSSACTKSGYVSVSNGALAPYGSALYVATVPIFTTGIGAYTLAHFAFTATSTSTRITFTATELSTAGMFVDDVSIAGSVCTPTTCGNARIDAGETCDDGNNADGDGCSSTCQLEAGFTCGAPGAACVPTCGDGVVVWGEECDDGNLVAGDGCSPTCTVEPGFQCGVGDTLDPRSVCLRPPVIATPTDGGTTLAMPFLSGTATPGATVTIVIDGVVVGTTTADASGNWTYVPTTPLSPGDHSVIAEIVSGHFAAHSPTIPFTVIVLSDGGPEGGTPRDGSVDGSAVDGSTMDGGAPTDGGRLGDGNPEATVPGGDWPPEPPATDMGPDLSTDMGTDLGSMPWDGHFDYDSGMDAGACGSHCRSNKGGCCSTAGASGGAHGAAALAVVLGVVALARRRRRARP